MLWHFKKNKEMKEGIKRNLYWFSISFINLCILNFTPVLLIYIKKYGHFKMTYNSEVLLWLNDLAIEHIALIAVIITVIYCITEYNTIEGTSRYKRLKYCWYGFLMLDLLVFHTCAVLELYSYSSESTILYELPHWFTISRLWTVSERYSILVQLMQLYSFCPSEEVQECIIHNSTTGEEIQRLFLESYQNYQNYQNTEPFSFTEMFKECKEWCDTVYSLGKEAVQCFYENKTCMDIVKITGCVLLALGVVLIFQEMVLSGGSSNTGSVTKPEKIKDITDSIVSVRAPVVEQTIASVNTVETQVVQQAIESVGTVGPQVVDQTIASVDTVETQVVQQAIESAGTLGTQVVQQTIESGSYFNQYDPTTIMNLAASAKEQSVYIGQLLALARKELGLLTTLGGDGLMHLETLKLHISLVENRGSVVVFIMKNIGENLANSNITYVVTPMTDISQLPSGFIPAGEQMTPVDVLCKGMVELYQESEVLFNTVGAVLENLPNAEVKKLLPDFTQVEIGLDDARAFFQVGDEN